MEKDKEQFQCKLCHNYFDESDMSDEHYPAKSVGNVDIVGFDIIKMFDLFKSPLLRSQISERMNNGETLEDIAGEIFDNELTVNLYPKGRTNKTLCKDCNTFLGKYDEAYLKFFKVDGESSKIRGFQKSTKIKIIKSIYAKFLSVPEADQEEFDFIDFIKNKDITKYHGKWQLFFVKRDIRTDLLGFADIRTGKQSFEKGVVYELSDDKFIYNLMNFDKHSCYEMSNIFDIYKDNYKLVVGTGENGGYHSQTIITSMFSDLIEEQEENL